MFFYKSRATDSMVPRVSFDPANKTHREIYAKFLRNKKWEGPIRFYLEWPYYDIPAMCQAKLCHYFLKVDLDPNHYRY